MAKLSMDELPDYLGKWLFTVIPPDGRHGACVYGGYLKNRDGIFYIDHSGGAVKIKDKTAVYVDHEEAADAAGL